VAHQVDGDLAVLGQQLGVALPRRAGVGLVLAGGAAPELRPAGVGEQLVIAADLDEEAVQGVHGDPPVALVVEVGGWCR
jgi:hypothetical protein